MLLRRLWDAVGLGRWLDARTEHLPGHYRPSLMVELWTVLLFYGGGVLDDLPLLERRNVRRLFGWEAVPDPTTFGRWLRRCGEALLPLLDQLLWHLVRWRWRLVGVPTELTLLLDSTVVVRYGTKQAGAERGYNPKKPGRPSHHPLLAFAQETGDCLGVIWRPGNASTAAGAREWISVLIHRLREAGVEEITVRLDKGFFSKAIVETLEHLDVGFLLKIPDHGWLAEHQRPWRRSKRGEGIFQGATTWTTSGRLWGARLLSVQLGQLSCGRTAVDDLDGNALLWTLGTLAYQLLHSVRTTALRGGWRTAQPDRLRASIFRLPGKLTRHARKLYLQLLRTEPVRKDLLRGLRRLGRAPPLTAAA